MESPRGDPLDIAPKSRELSAYSLDRGPLSVPLPPFPHSWRLHVPHVYAIWKNRYHYDSKRRGGHSNSP
eukprot:scaffold25524_cov39-Tisochrysis_lutea.AAC.1